MIEIIMATYNGKDYIKEQIESIIHNDYQDWHLTIRDDGSTDATAAIVNKYVQRYPEKITWYTNEVNLGVAANFLTGVQKSTAEYVMVCDQDDVWDSDKISGTLKKLQSMEARYTTKRPIAVFTDARLVDCKRKLLQESFFEVSKLEPKKRKLCYMLMENKLLGCTVMLNAALREKLEVLPKGMRMHDWWIALIAASFGSVGYWSRTTMDYRQHNGNLVGGSDFIQYIKTRAGKFTQQKAVLKKTVAQAEEFLVIYGEQLGEKPRKEIQQFAALYQVNWWRRRRIVMQYHFYKSGIIRNIGLMLLM